MSKGGDKLSPPFLFRQQAVNKGLIVTRGDCPRVLIAKRNNNKEEELKEVVAVCDYLQLED